MHAMKKARRLSSGLDVAVPPRRDDRRQFPLSRRSLAKSDSNQIKLDQGGRGDAAKLGRAPKRFFFIRRHSNPFQAVREWVSAILRPSSGKLQRSEDSKKLPNEPKSQNSICLQTKEIMCKAYQTSGKTNPFPGLCGSARIFYPPQIPKKFLATPPALTQNYPFGGNLQF